MKLTSALVLAPVLALTFAGSPSQAASTLDAPVIEAPVTPWQRFDDPMLQPLQRLARAHLKAPDEASDARIALALVAWRTVQVRSTLLADIGQVMQRQRALMRAEAPQQSAAQAMAELDQREAAAAQLRASFEARAAALAETLATLTGSSVEQVRAWLAVPAADGLPLAIPAFTPSRLMPAAWRPADATLSTLTAEAEGWSARSAQQRQAVQQLARRWNAGAATERELLDGYTRLLGVDDALAVARAQLADAWIGALSGASSTAEAAPVLGSSR